MITYIFNRSLLLGLRSILCVKLSRVLDMISIKKLSMKRCMWTYSVGANVCCLIENSTYMKEKKKQERVMEWKYV